MTEQEARQQYELNQEEIETLIATKQECERELAALFFEQEKLKKIFLTE